MPTVRIDGRRLTDWDSFHTAFAEVFGFPDFYGRNLDAWIDCMTSLDSPEDGLTTIHGSPTDPVVIHLANPAAVPSELLDALSDCSAFVNWRRVEAGEPAILILSVRRSQPLDTTSRAVAYDLLISAILDIRTISGTDGVDDDLPEINRLAHLIHNWPDALRAAEDRRDFSPVLRQLWRQRDLRTDPWMAERLATFGIDPRSLEFDTD